MKSFAGWLIVLSIGSALLPYIGLQFILLSWIDSWGPTVGWCIRGGFIVLGVAILMFPSGKASPAADPSGNLPVNKPPTP